MKREVEKMILSMNTYEKQELMQFLMEEILENHNDMLSNLNNIEGHVFGMVNNSEHNNLNELTLTQLGRIEKLSKVGK
jgi:hypothetical protein